MSNFPIILNKIVSSPFLHARFLNTLSYMENCGARKIAQCEHPTMVKEKMLKHAAEEFRHAHYLKKQIPRVSEEKLSDYSIANLLGGFTSYHYLNKLDLQISDYLKQQKLSKTHFKESIYLLVTYAIEVRAESFYPLYHEILKKNSSKVTVKSILLEELEHLEEMREGLKVVDPDEIHINVALALERELFSDWVEALIRDAFF